jgi:hypothetical protein
VHPLERGEARPREARILERGEACLRGSSSGPPWWAVGASVAWAMSCMVKRGVFGFGFVAGFKWGFPSCLRGPLGLSPTLITLTFQMVGTMRSSPNGFGASGSGDLTPPPPMTPTEAFMATQTEVLRQILQT